MQKKLIALAVTAAFASAPAFADTTVYGLVDVGAGSVQNTTTSASTGVATKTGQSGVDFSQNQTSKVGVTATEDLGNGMKASYMLEMGLSSNPGADANFGKSAIAGGSGYTPNATISPDRVLAVALDLGEGTTLVGGKVSSPLRGIVYGNDAMYGANLVGNLLTMDGDLTTRAVAIAALHKFGAVNFSAAVLDNTITKDGANDVKAGNGFEITAVYNQDALSVSAGYRSLQSSSNAVAAVASNTTTTPITLGSALVAATDLTTKVTVLAANYNFGVAKLYGQYANIQSDDSITAAATTTGKRNYESLGVNVPFTPVFAGYVELGAGSNKMNTGTAADSRSVNAYAVGVKYDLSKTTSAYAHVGSAKMNAGTTLAGSKVDQYAFGLMKSF